MSLDGGLYCIGAPSGDWLALASDDDGEWDKADDQEKAHAPN